MTPLFIRLQLGNLQLSQHGGRDRMVTLIKLITLHILQIHKRPLSLFHSNLYQRDTFERLKLKIPQTIIPHPELNIIAETVCPASRLSRIIISIKTPLCFFRDESAKTLKETAIGDRDHFRFDSNKMNKFNQIYLPIG